MPRLKTLNVYPIRLRFISTRLLVSTPPIFKRLFLKAVVCALGGDFLYCGNPMLKLSREYYNETQGLKIYGAFAALCDFDAKVCEFSSTFCILLRILNKEGF